MSGQKGYPNSPPLSEITRSALLHSRSSHTDPEQPLAPSLEPITNRFVKGFGEQDSWHWRSTYDRMFRFQCIVNQRQHIYIGPIRSTTWSEQNRNHPRSLKTALSVFSCNILRLSRRVIIPCGGSFRANSGFRDGRTRDANCEGERSLDMLNTFGRIDVNKYGSFI